MKKILFAMFAFTLVAAACGGDDDGGGDVVSAEDSEFVAAIADAAVEGNDPDSPLRNREDAECFAGRIVGAIGEERLVELGVSPDDAGDIGDYAFTEGEIDTIVDSLDKCIDLRAALAETMTADFGEEGANCVADELSDGLLQEMMAAGFTDAEPPDSFFQEFLDIAAKCDLPLG